MPGMGLPRPKASRTAFRPGFDRLEARGLLSAVATPVMAGSTAEVRAMAADEGFTPLFGGSGLSGWRIPTIGARR